MLATYEVEAVLDSKQNDLSPEFCEKNRIITEFEDESSAMAYIYRMAPQNKIWRFYLVVRSKYIPPSIYPFAVCPT